MKKVIFPLAWDSTAVVYPDAIGLFSNSEIIGAHVVADYAGQLPLTPYVPAQRPQLVITGISADAANAARTAITPTHDDVTCPAGTVLNISAQLQSGGAPLPVTDTFRMPVVARDGREKVLLVALLDGVANFSAPMRESGVWEVTQTMINQGLPAAEQMDFPGFTIYVVEAE